MVILYSRQHFYITEAEPTAHRLRFFRKISWLHVEQHACYSLHQACFSAAPERAPNRDGSGEFISAASTSLVQNFLPGGQSPQESCKQSHVCQSSLSEDTRHASAPETCATIPGGLPGDVSDKTDGVPSLEKTLHPESKHAKQASTLRRAQVRRLPESPSPYEERGRVRKEMQSTTKNTSDEARRGMNTSLVFAAERERRASGLEADGEAASRIEGQRGLFRQGTTAPDRRLLLLSDEAHQSKPRKRRNDASADRGCAVLLNEKILSVADADDPQFERKDRVGDDRRPEDPEAGSFAIFSGDSTLARMQT